MREVDVAVSIPQRLEVLRSQRADRRRVSPGRLQAAHDPLGHRALPVVPDRDLAPGRGGRHLVRRGPGRRLIQQMAQRLDDHGHRTLGAGGRLVPGPVPHGEAETPPIRRFLGRSRDEPGVGGRRWRPRGGRLRGAEREHGRTRELNAREGIAGRRVLGEDDDRVGAQIGHRSRQGRGLGFRHRRRRAVGPLKGLRPIACERLHPFPALIADDDQSDAQVRSPGRRRALRLRKLNQKLRGRADP
jgi:hypothetical protein